MAPHGAAVQTPGTPLAVCMNLCRVLLDEPITETDLFLFGFGAEMNISRWRQTLL
jgi:hypothetical protein